MTPDSPSVARDVMTTGCSCIKHDQTVVDASRQMQREDVGSLPICGPDETLVGMLTDRDIVIKCLAAGKDPSRCTAGELAEGTMIWVRDTELIEDVLSRMEEHQIRRVPVIDEARQLVGIISQGDIATRLDHEHAGELVEAISRD